LNKYLLTLGLDNRIDNGEKIDTALVFKIWDFSKIGSYFDYSDTVPTGGEIFTYVQNNSSPVCYRIKIDNKDYFEEQIKFT